VRCGWENVRVCSGAAAFDWLEGLSDRLCLFEGRSLGGGDGCSEDLGGIPDPKSNGFRRWLGTAEWLRYLGVQDLESGPLLPSGAFETVPDTYRVR